MGQRLLPLKPRCHAKAAFKPVQDALQGDYEEYAGCEIEGPPGKKWAK